MRRIYKDAPHPSFHTETKGLKRWDQFRERSRQFRDYILSQEQEGRSAYTERCVKLEGTHIDHFYKRELFPQRCFDWNNLLVAEDIEAYGAKYKDNKCKLQKADYQLIIDPVADEPQQYFRYMANGQISPKLGLSELEQQKAQRTIEVFNLNHPDLVGERCTHWRYVENYYLGGLSKQDILECSSAFPSLTEFVCSLL